MAAAAEQEIDIEEVRKEAQQWMRVPQRGSTRYVQIECLPTTLTEEELRDILSPVILRDVVVAKLGCFANGVTS